LPGHHHGRTGQQSEAHREKSVGRQPGHDGNRSHQQRELWKLLGEGSQIRNNGITVQGVSDSVIANVTSARCRSRRSGHHP